MPTSCDSYSHVCLLTRRHDVTSHAPPCRHATPLYVLCHDAGFPDPAKANPARRKPPALHLPQDDAINYNYEHAGRGAAPFLCMHSALFGAYTNMCDAYTEYKGSFLCMQHELYVYTHLACLRTQAAFAVHKKHSVYTRKQGLNQSSCRYPKNFTCTCTPRRFDSLQASWLPCTCDAAAFEEAVSPPSPEHDPPSMSPACE